MKKYDHLRKRAREWRQEGLSLTEICERLSLSKGTVHYWIKDLPKPKERTRKQTAARKRASKANSEKAAAKRQAAYNAALATAEQDLQDQGLRDFVVTYLGEGYRRSRNTVAVANSNPALVALSNRFIKAHTQRKVSYHLQYHEDNDVEALQRFWAAHLGVAPENIGLQRKSNSGSLSGRKWRSVQGVLTIRTHDTYFRSELQAWMDYVQAQWLSIGA